MSGPDAGEGIDFQEAVAALFLCDLLRQAYEYPTVVEKVSIDHDYVGGSDLLVTRRDGSTHAVYIRRGAQRNHDAKKSLWASALTSSCASVEFVLGPSTYGQSLRRLQDRLQSPSGAGDLPGNAGRVYRSILDIGASVGIPAADVRKFLTRRLQLSTQPDTSVELHKRLLEKLSFVDPHHMQKSWAETLCRLAKSKHTYDLAGVMRAGEDAGILDRGLPGDYADASESGQLSVIDGVTWTKLYDLLRNRNPDDRRPFVQAHPNVYLHAFETIATAAVLSSALGYDKNIADLDRADHPVKQLKHAGDFAGRVVEIEPAEPFDLDLVQERHAESLRGELSRLTLNAVTEEHYGELLLRDADRFFLLEGGLPHPTLWDPALRFTEYVFRKPYAVNEGLCEAVASRFVATLARRLEPRFGAHSIQRSREAFVRRMAATHIAIGYNYRQTFRVAGPASRSLACQTQHVLGTPTRSKEILIRAASGHEATGEVLRYITPLCMREFLSVTARGASPIEGLEELRRTRWARLARKVMAEIDSLLIKGDRRTAERRARELLDHRAAWRIVGEVNDLYASVVDANVSAVHKHLILALYKRRVDAETRRQFALQFIEST